MGGTTARNENGGEVGREVLVGRLGPHSELMRQSFSGGKTDEELQKVYDTWSNDYLKDTANAGYVAPPNTCKVFRKNFPANLDPKTAKVLDCGCGTGLVADYLVTGASGQPGDEKFLNLHGLDFSPGMLDKARDSNKPYVSLQQGNVLETLAIKDNDFDALISVGMFTSGNVGPSALEQLMRIVKPGGAVTISIQDHIFIPEGFPAEIERLEKKGICRVASVEMISTMTKIDTFGHVYTFEVL